MEIEILQERENKALSRKEIDFRVNHTGATTPSRAEVRAKISAMYDADLEVVVVRHLSTKFGIGVTHGSARIYKSPEGMKRVELEYIVRRHEAKKEGA